jgi:hypothetical protein
MACASRFPFNAWQVLLQLRIARCNRLPQTCNLTLKRAHLAPHDPTLLRRPADVFRSLRPLAFHHGLIQPVNSPIEQAERPTVQL